MPTREVANRRGAPRVTLVAEANITDIKTGTSFRARISELATKGCYLDVLNPLPDGSEVKVKITRDKGIFESMGKIVYNNPGMGLGVVFVDTAPEQQRILDGWVSEISD
jgi:PilZ domain